MSSVHLITGDNMESLKWLAADSIDAIVTDPPYGLSKEPDMAEVLKHWLVGDDHEATGSGFMGKTWDSFVPGPAVWKEVYRVLKPGGYLLSFSGTRTFDMAALAIRLAGFEVRDCLSWMYGQGFPKSMDMSKAIDKEVGVEGSLSGPDAEQWAGWGTALKPAWEPIIMARKPLSGKTVAANVLKYGTGALNIDATRISTTDSLGGGAEKETRSDQKGNDGWTRPWMDDPEAQAAHAATVRANVAKAETLGRFPANVMLSHHEDCMQQGVKMVQSNGHYPSARPGATTITTVGHSGQEGLDERYTKGEVVEAWECVSECPVRMLDEQTGTLTSGRAVIGTGTGKTSDVFGQASSVVTSCFADSGGASRFFYNAKAAKSERSAGLPEGTTNDHPTVKPVAVMEWLIKLVCPPGGWVLDPFVGSGSTAVAAVKSGINLMGMDLDRHYIEDIAQHRVMHAGGIVVLHG